MFYNSFSQWRRTTVVCSLTFRREHLDSVLRTNPFWSHAILVSSFRTRWPLPSGFIFLFLKTVFFFLRSTIIIIMITPWFVRTIPAARSVHAFLLYCFVDGFYFLGKLPVAPQKKPNSVIFQRILLKGTLFYI